MTHRMVGSLIGGVFGLIFVLVNVGALAAPVAIALRALAVAAFVLVAVQVRRNGLDAPPAPAESNRGGFGSGYWLIVAAEVVGFVIGGVLLSGPLNKPDAGVAWVAFVVGVHFFALARLWHLRLFDVLGGALALCGIVGLALAFADADQAAVATVGGVLPGVVLLGFGLWGSRKLAA